MAFRISELELAAFARKIKSLKDKMTNLKQKLCDQKAKRAKRRADRSKKKDDIAKLMAETIAKSRRSGFAMHEVRQSKRTIAIKVQDDTVTVKNTFEMPNATELVRIESEIWANMNANLAAVLQADKLSTVAALKSFECGEEAIASIYGSGSESPERDHRSASSKSSFATSTPK